ncbi:ARD/ARD' family domain containing protein [Tylopilus felleus]
MRACSMDDIPVDQCLPHDSGREASDDVLKSIGVFHWHIPIDEMGTSPKREREYKNHDVIVISKKSLGDEFETKIKNFYHEHMHEDEEISGYFDVREHATESWIRCHMSAGDLLVLPAGIYHRFSLDMTTFVRTMTLFKDEPKWIAHRERRMVQPLPYTGAVARHGGQSKAAAENPTRANESRFSGLFGASRKRAAAMANPPSVTDSR